MEMEMKKLLLAAVMAVKSLGAERVTDDGQFNAAKVRGIHALHESLQC